MCDSDDWNKTRYFNSDSDYVQDCKTFIGYISKDKELERGEQMNK